MCIDGFDAVEWLPKSCSVHGVIDGEHSMTVKRKGRNTYVFINKGTVRIRLHMDMFENIYNLKESIAIISSYLDGQHDSKDV